MIKLGYIKKINKNLNILALSLIFLLIVGCRVIPEVSEESNRMNLAQKKILSNDFEDARKILSNIYAESNLKPEKGEALYWIAYTHIKESSYREARNFLEIADKLYRSGHLLGPLSARIIACALMEGDESRANKQYGYIENKRVGEMPEINFIMGNYFQKKGSLQQAKIYFQKCSSAGDNFYSRKVRSLLSFVGEGSFYLQVGKFSNLNNVNNLMKKLKDEYYLDPYIKESTLNGNELYTICIGKFNTQVEAENELKLMKTKYPQLQLIIRP